MANKRIVDLTTQAAIVDADWLEVQVSTEAVTKKSSVNVVTKVERDARIAQDDVIEAGVGLAAAGTYVTPVGTNYIDTSTDVMSALNLLDDAIGDMNVVTLEVSIPNANLNIAGATPYEIIPAPGAGKYIEVISASCSFDYTAPQMAWAIGSPKGVLQYDTGASHFMEWSNTFMVSTADIINKGTWTSEVGIIANKKVEFTFDSAPNPTAGGSRLNISITYVIWDV